MINSVSKVDLQLLIENSLIQTAPKYVELQRAQMFSGIDSDGKKIRRIGAKYEVYAPKTIAIKERKGQPTDRVTLKDAGDFQSDVFAETREDGIASGSMDSKSNKLQEDYGQKIFGLSDNPKQEYINDLRPVTMELLISELNKK